ncbi:hypothetical protein N7532_006758 [Penicillium argentinense]|uniref:NAD(P)-binding domain-containing protein n=1 Tax=Penicillium argentinense TaxID=1131581 RepID=A0A9W9FGV6_9EURO|nr:uncharacterized protein N7532_006758 [Penicillium argentinense]KAJ5099757.1 hypothetical protein N7532_006758 [Penicillium argentinense]
MSLANYDDIDSLQKVFAGPEAVTLTSTWASGRRHQQAQNVIDAAKTCGVRRICYTSFVGADDPAPRDYLWLSNSGAVPGAYVAREECGRVLAPLLLGRGKPNTVYNVTGLEAITNEQVFRWICDNVKDQGHISTVSDQEMKDYWLQRGLPTPVSGDFSQTPMKLCIDDLLCCREMVAKGYMANANNAVGMLAGRKPLAFQDALAKYTGVLS